MKNIHANLPKRFFGPLSKVAADCLFKYGIMPIAGGAVINDYVDALTAAGKLNKGSFIGSGQMVLGITTFEVAAADSDGSIYRLFKNISPNLVPIRALIYNDAITSGSDWDLGIYAPLLEGGAVYSADVFLNGGDLSSAHLVGSGLSGMSAVDQANIQKMIFEHAGHTILTKKRGYDIALTANTVGSAAGTVSVLMEFAQG